MENEVIILSSDEDSESPRILEGTVSKHPDVTVSVQLLKEKLRQNLNSMGKPEKNDEMKLKVNRKEEEDTISPTPEIVDLVEGTDKSPESGHCTDTRKNDPVKNHSKPNNGEADDADKIEIINETTNADVANGEKNSDTPLIEITPDSELSTNETDQTGSEDIILVKNNMTEDNHSEISKDAKKTPDKSSNGFKDFLDYCGSLEDNLKDREKLLDKLKKHYEDAHPEYVNSQEFKNLITKCKNKINNSNLYLVTKTISDELRLRKIPKNPLKEESAEVYEIIDVEEEANNCSLSPQERKRLAKIDKIMKRLNHLGRAIRELEKEEVDLSDEEDSVYLKLQRLREIFWTVYKRLCDFSDELDIGIFEEKIHFTETQYPAINRCIEKWLNRTKSFPDFADVLKVLESRSAELNLPSDKEMLRSTAIDIFQKIGKVLQRKRKYDLWNGFSDFLEETEDPAVKNPELEKIFRKNYEARVKKEEEIYQLYVERQEKESLEAKEIAEDEANDSPESGKEEEEEIRDIEQSLEGKLFDGCSDTDKQASDDETSKNANGSSKDKKSKNDFKNCKSLKWRSEKSRSESSDNSAGEMEEEVKEIEKPSSPKPILIELESNQMEVDPEPVNEVTTLPVTTTPLKKTPKKRSASPENENARTKKKSLKKEETADVGDLKNGTKDTIKPAVYDVGYCQVVTNYNPKENRKVFKDLTNLNRLMKMAGLFRPTFLYSRYSPKKETLWKKRFRINLRELKPKNRKCALNEEEKTGEKTRSPSSRDSEDKDNNKGSGSEGRQESDSSGQGNGEQEDNNDKGGESRKNGKVEDENDDREEDDDEEKEDENAEADEHSSNTQKTEESSELQPNNEIFVEGETKKEEKEEQGEQEKEEGNSPNRGDDDEFRGIKSEDVEEMENNSLEPICVLKEGDATEVVEKRNRENPPVAKSEEWSEAERFRTGPFTRSKLRARMGERSKSESQNQTRLPVTAAWIPPSETSQPKTRKMSASDEERVKRFLMHSPSSISITPPKKLTLSKPPSQSALQALATLRNLKGISATIVKAKPKNEDAAAGGQSTRGAPDQSITVRAKRRRTDSAATSNVQSGNTLTPKIVTVQGNVSGFENLWPEMTNNGNTGSDSSSIRISKVWGSLPGPVVQANSSPHPGCSSRKSNPGTSNQMRRKNAKKQVEYVVLD